MMDQKVAGENHQRFSDAGSWVARVRRVDSFLRKTNMLCSDDVVADVPVEENCSLRKK